LDEEQINEMFSTVYDESAGLMPILIEESNESVASSIDKKKKLILQSDSDLDISIEKMQSPKVNSKPNSQKLSEILLSPKRILKID
jgi:hypothetical protein